MNPCKHCGSTEVFDGSGEVVCNNCGAVVESNIVSEVQYQENASGLSTVLGQFVSHEGGSGVYGTSKQLTITNARARILKLAYQLNIHQHIEMAVRIFRLAVGRHLTKGRNSEHVAAACLYIACRTDVQPILLLDFSDKVKVDVFRLGRIYRYFAKKLNIPIPILDPCLYIERYARQLEFGDKTMDVCRTANYLVSSMNRDWMVEGRRPSGICGAAILVAARTFNFNRTIQDIMKVVRIGERTIKNRLKEFEQTESSKMTIDEFHSLEGNGNAEEHMDPPCYTAGLKRAKIAEETEDLSKLLEEAEQLKKVLEDGIQEMITRKQNRSMVSDMEASDKCVTEEDLSLNSVALTMEDLDNELATYQDLLNDTYTQNDNNGRAMYSCPETPSSIVEENSEIEELEEILSQNMNHTEEFQLNDITNCLDEEIAEDDSDEELNLDGIDDDEVNEMILNNVEVKIKTVRWMRENADFLKEMNEKKGKKAQDLLHNPKVKRKPREIRQKKEFGSVQDAIKHILKDNNLGDKINYDVLANFDIGPLKRLAEPTVVVNAVVESQQSQERCESPPEKKIRIETSEDVLTVQKQEAESEDDDNDEQYYYDEDDQENQPDNQQECMFQYEENHEDYDEYCDSD